MHRREALAALARQWIALWSVPVDWALFDALHDDAFEDCAAGGRPPTKAGFAAGLRALIAAFPDLQAQVEGLVIDEVAGQVAVRWSARGTNRAAYLGAGPTGRMTRITGIEIIGIEGGRIVRRWGEWDISAHTGA